MNLLLLNPPLPLSLMSFPRTCQIVGAKFFTPPLGLITVAALLPETWEVRLVDLNCSELSEEDWRWAEVVLLSGMFLQGQGLLYLLREAKKRGKFVVCGGPYVTSVPEPAQEAGADVLVRGEAEFLGDEIVEAISSRQSGIVIQAPAKPDITHSPVPRFDILDLSKYMSMAIQTSRGCPFECEFCDVVHLYGRKMRYKKPEQVVNELEALYHCGWTGLMFVSDDNFIGSKAHARAILREITSWSKSHGEPFAFVTQVSLNLAGDPDLVDLMTEANFSLVLIGVESPDRLVLEHNRKMQNVENPIGESLKVLNSRGLTVLASFVIGFDGEEKGVDERICSLVESEGIGLVFINVLQAMPNTRLWKRLQDEGRLLPHITSGETLASRMNFIPSRPMAEIMQEWADTWKRLYQPDRTLERISQGILSMRPTRRAMGIEVSEPSGQGPEAAQMPPKRKWAELAFLIRFLLLMGFRRPTAFSFWKGLLTVWTKNPSRLVRYFESCSIAANLISLRDEIQKRSAGAIERARDLGDANLDSVPPKARSMQSR